MTTKFFNTRYLPEFKFITVLILIFLYAPLLVLVIYGFNSSHLATEWGGFSVQWFNKAMGNADLRRAAINSVIVAITATSIATLVAIPAAIGFERGRFQLGRRLAESLVKMPLVAPDIVTAIATLVFFTTIGLQLGLANVIFAHIVFCIPFAMLPIRGRLREMSTDVENAARDLYATEWEVFTRITLPGLRPGILAGAMLAFVISLDDFIITLMVAPAGATTLPVYIYGMLRVGVTPEANAAATMLLAVSVICVTLSYFLTTRKPSRL
jgi:spermidine/putrescine transport system permease protein